MDYVQITPKQREEMLKAVGARSMEDLLRQVPDALRLEGPLELPAALDEWSLSQHMAQLAGQDRAADQRVCFLGGGAYDHFIPAVVDAMTSRGEFLTAYTPYQAEASQGSLQAFFEFQTMICQLTGMEVANASLYEGATALAEAVLMALSATGKRVVLVSRGVNPQYRQVLKTYLSDLPAEYIEVPLKAGVTDTQALEGAMDEETAAVVVQSPNYLGHIERIDTIAKFAHANESLCIQAFNPLSLGLLKHPGEMDVDIATAEGQPLGIPLQFGGPYLGLFACKNKFVRKMPGRLVGQTVDSEGRRAYCLTLQTREQHIRREKATSNVCTNQGLMALRATIYLSAMGPKGLRQAAQLCLDKASYLAGRLEGAGIPRYFPEQSFFNEILVRLDRPAQPLLQAARKAGYLAGLSVQADYPELPGGLLIAVTEKRTRAEMDRLVELLSMTGGRRPVAEVGHDAAQYVGHDLSD